MIAAKTRETDQKTPYATEIKKLKENIWTKAELKQAEIRIANYFEWNMHFFTFFDYIQNYLSTGILFSSDILLNSKSESIKSTASKSGFSSQQNSEYSPFPSDFIKYKEKKGNSSPLDFESPFKLEHSLIFFHWPS